MLQRQTEHDKKQTESYPFTFLTFNIGCLPGDGLLNYDTLAPNHIRVSEIIKRINQWHESPSDAMPAPSVIAFQEAFDSLEHIHLGKRIAPYFTRHALKEGLATHYRYNTDHLGDHVRESGLLLFSKFPIMGAYYEPFKDIMRGNERLAIKGFIRVKLQVNSEYFISVYTTHLEAGGAYAKHYQSEHHGTTSARRNDQLGRIYQDMATKRKAPPTGTESKYLKSFFLGDLNDTYNEERNAFALSTGKSNNGFEKDATKYPNRKLLFQEIIQFTLPDNFINVLTINPAPKGPKFIDQTKLAEAKQKNLFIGTPIKNDKLTGHLTEGTALTPQDTQPKIIDVLAASKDGEPGKLNTRILLFNELSGKKESDPSDKEILSDHHPVYGKWTPSVFKPVTQTTTEVSASRDQRQCIIM